MPRLPWRRKEKVVSTHHESSPAVSSSTSGPSSATQPHAEETSEISPTEVKVYENLWDQAYDDLRKEKKELVDTFERILKAESEDETLTLPDDDPSKREKQMSTLVTKKLETMNQHKWRIKFGNKSIEVREQVDRILKIVLVAKPTISAVAAIDPIHAGLPWAGVCTLLDLLTRDGTQRDDAVKGLEKVSQVVRRYAEVERIYCQDKPAELQQSLQRGIVKLYSLVLEYEAKATCQFNRNVATQFARNIVEVDGWKGILTGIQESDIACKEIMVVLDAEDERLRSSRLEASLDRQNQLISELLLVSREQDERLLEELQGGRQEQKSWRQEQLDWKLNAHQSSCLEALRTTEYELQRNKIPDRVPGTCEWFLGHPKYQDWLVKDVTWLWVTADPGCGKSVLSRHLVDVYEDERQTERLSVCYFFFKDDSDENKSAAHALCSLLHQLFKQNKALIKHAMPAFEENGNKLPHLFLTLWSILVAATADPEAGRTICVLDALDECEELSRSTLIQSLANLFSKNDNNARLKFISTSRPNATIENEIRRRRGESIRLMGENEQEMKAIAKEISLVIRARVEIVRDFRLANGIEDDAHLALQEKLDGIENRTYLWVALVFPELEENAGLTENKLLNSVDTIPKTVEEAYAKMLAKYDTPRARKLLQIVVAAMRPLSIAEINVALSLEECHTSLDECDLEPEMSFRASIRKLCGLFVTVFDSKVYLIHQTAKEFLSSDKATQDSSHDTGLRGWKHLLNPRDSNITITKACILYLSLREFEDDPLDLEIEPSVLSSTPRTTFLHRKRTLAEYQCSHCFLDYAAAYWTIHFQGSQLKQKDPLMDSVFRLCDIQSGRYQTWSVSYWGPSYNSPGLVTDLMVGSYFGIEPVVQVLLERDDVPLNAKDDRGKTALRWAASKGHEGVIKLLLSSKKIDPNLADTYSITPLLGAVRQERQSVVRTLLENSKVNLRAYGEIDLLLKESLSNRHEWIAKMILVKKDADPNLAGDETSLLLYALGRRNERTVKLFLERKRADPNSKDEDGRTPLWKAAMNDDRGIVRLLLDVTEIDVTARDNRGDVLLLSLLQKGLKSTSRLLLTHPEVDPNQCNNNGLSPLLWAIEEGENGMVELMLQHCVRCYQRPNISMKDKHGWSIDTLLSISGFASQGHTRWHDDHRAHLSQCECTKAPDALVSAHDEWGFRICSDGLTATSSDLGLSKSWDDASAKRQVRGNHPVPPGASTFYFEVKIDRLGERGIVGIGLCQAGSPWTGTMPGWRVDSWAYHGDDGGLFHDTIGEPTNSFVLYGAGDTIGCGFNYQTQSVFFTKNGENLGVAFTDVKGIVFPVIAVGDRGSEVQVNFGRRSFVYKGLEETKFGVA